MPLFKSLSFVSLRPFLFFSFLCSLNLLQAQAPQWNWALNAGGNENESGQQIICDPSGNVVSWGTFESGAISFGSIGLANLTPSGSNRQAYYIAKHDASGNVVWASTFPEEWSEITHAIMDDQGNLYVAGRFYGTLVLGGVSLTLTGSAAIAPVIIKYDPAGNVIWMKQKGGDINPSQAFLFFKNFTRFDSSHFMVTGLAANDTIDGHYIKGATWLAKMDTTGTFSSFITLDTLGIYASLSGDISISSMKVDNQQNTYITGSYTGTAPFVSSVWHLDTIPGNNTEVFIAKFDRNLNFTWSKMSHTSTSSGYGTGNVHSNGLAFDLQGNVYHVGGFQADTLVLAPNRKHVFPYSPFSTTSGNFLVKYKPDGAVVWDSIFIDHNPYKASFTSIFSDKTGGIYCGGTFNGNLTLNGITVNGGTLFVARFAQDGRARWMQIGAGNLSLNGIAEDGKGNVFATGNFLLGNATFGTTATLVNTAPGSNPYAGDLYIARLGNCTNTTGPTLSPNGAQHLCNNDSLLLSSSPVAHYTWSTGDTTASIMVRHAGTYFVYGSDNLGCYAASSSAQITTGLANSSVTVSGSTLTAQQANGVYQWIDCGHANKAINTATAQAFHPAQSGSYALVITQNGCTDTSACYPVTISPLSVADQTDATAIRFFPNPNRGQFTIEFPATGKPGQLLLVDVLGKILFEKMIHSGTSNFDVSNLADGVYQLILISDGQRCTQKMVIQR